MSDAIHSSSRMAIANTTNAHAAVTISNSSSRVVLDDIQPPTVSSAVPVTMEIESRDVIRSILQFLKEQNLTEAMKALQSESGITLNTIDNLESFKSDILNGRWDLVLKQTSSLSLPIEKLTALYEQVVFELLEVGERDLAKHIVRTSVPLISLKSTSTGRYLKLEELCKRTFFSESDAYEMGTTKELRRHEIAEMLVCEVSVVQPSRLLALLGQALKYQQSQDMLPLGVPFDLFRNARKLNKKDVEDKVPKRSMGDLQSVKGSKVESLSFSCDGLNVLASSLDGIIASFDVETLRLNVNLEYQNSGQLMTLTNSCSDCILCSATSKDGELLAVGTRNGQVHVYKLSSGTCVRSFPQAHPQGVTSLCFYRDGTQILTTSFDQTARIHGLKSGKALKEFRGHSSYVNCGLYTKDSVLTGSSDGTVKLWDLRTTECLQTFRPGLVPGSTVKREHPIHTIQLVPNTSDQLFICTNSGYAYITTMSGQLVKVFTTGKASSTADFFTCGTISPQGKYAYCVGEDRMLHAFEVKSGQLDSSLQLSTASTGHIDSIVHHPHRNLIATISSIAAEGAMLWIP